MIIAKTLLDSIPKTCYDCPFYAEGYLYYSASDLCLLTKRDVKWNTKGGSSICILEVLPEEEQEKNDSERE